ncbi:MAG: hypothetical protein WD847_04330 [Pirellulales bacterium]
MPATAQDSFDPTNYAPAVTELLEPERLNELGPGQPNLAARRHLVELAQDPSRLARDGRVDDEWAAACLAGLWLYHDFLDESHRVSQELNSIEGSYWHGIMHRREPDYGNAKYWFRRVGGHPIGDRLTEDARRLAGEHALDATARFLIDQPAWDHARFVDLCQAAASGESPRDALVRRVQLREWQLLFDYCYRRACLASPPG